MKRGRRKASRWVGWQAGAGRSNARELVILAELVHAENGDNILKTLVVLENLLDGAVGGIAHESVCELDEVGPLKGSDGGGRAYRATS